MPKLSKTRQMFDTLRNLNNPQTISSKTSAEITVKSPRIRVSKDFVTKYPTPIPTNRYFGREGSLEKQTKDSHLTITEIKGPYVENRLLKSLAKAQTTEEIARIEMKFRKLKELYTMQSENRNNFYIKIHQIHDRQEAIQSERIERFRTNFEEMIRKFEEKLLIDTRKIRKKERFLFSA